MTSCEASPTGGLRVHTPAPEYLFAMKCMAMRPDGMDGSHDISDIEALAHRWTSFDLIFQLQQNMGGANSEFGILPNHRVIQLLGTYYF